MSLIKIITTMHMSILISRAAPLRNVIIDNTRKLRDADSIRDSDKDRVWDVGIFGAVCEVEFGSRGAFGNDAGEAKTSFSGAGSRC
jgi:hypothetical protein